LPADGERAGNDAADRGSHYAGQDCEFGRESPDFRRVGREVAGPAEIERVAKRQKPHISDQQIEGAGKQRKAHRLHQEQRVDHERRHDQRNDHDGEGDHFALLAPYRRLPGERVDDSLHHALRPNSPAGRTNSTMAMITKITVFEASGKNTLVRPSTTPSPKPVTIAPRIEPMPPITTTANTTMISSEPICGDTLKIGAAITPANAASATPNPYVNVIMRGTLMPKARTSVGFSVAARK